MIDQYTANAQGSDVSVKSSNLALRFVDVPKSDSTEPVHATFFDEPGVPGKVSEKYKFLQLNRRKACHCSYVKVAVTFTARQPSGRMSS